MGRFGTNQLVNGTDKYQSSVKADSVVRYYLTNSASVRVFRFAIAGAKLKLIGADNGLYEQEKLVESVTLAPSERAVVDVYFPSEGMYPIQNATPNKTYTIGMIRAKGIAVANNTIVDRFSEERTHGSVTAGMEIYRAKAADPPDKRVAVRMKMDMSLMNMMAGHNSGMMGGDTANDSETEDGIEWEDTMLAMNAKSTTKNVKWSLVDLDAADGSIDWSFTRGEIVKLQIANSATTMHPMQHPIHIHGQRFLVTSIDGVPQANLVWKDSIMIPVGKTYELVVAMDNPGNWLIHCHIPEHMEAGMMGKFNVQ
jgi:FtsP/CotA-like multicopper oxidase with cupredoxin domain